MKLGSDNLSFKSILSVRGHNPVLWDVAGKEKWGRMLLSVPP